MRTRATFCFALTAGLVAGVGSTSANAAETAASATGNIVGRVSFAGDMPAPAVIEPDQDPGHCGDEHEIGDQSLLVTDGGVANTVLILEGAPATAKASHAKAKLTQDNCSFVPHVQTVTAGTTVTISNDDGVLHNVHAFMSNQTLFNVAIPIKGLRVERTLNDAGVVSVRCDAGHPRTKAIIVVAPHPYHATSAQNGNFTIPDVPAGTYKLIAWHERLGSQEAEVTVTAGKAARANFNFLEADDDGDGGSPPAAADPEAALEERLGELEDELVEQIEETQEAVKDLQQQRLWDARASYAEDGRELYLEHCAPCHGRLGDGKGPAAQYLDGFPRDFTKGEYQFRMTESGKLPTERDLFRTISVGVLGTAMPAWRKKLTRKQRKLLARYVMSLSPRFWKKRKRAAKLIEIPEEPKSDAKSVARGKKIYVEMKCAQCHGKSGRGDGPAAKTMKDDSGNPIEPYDLTLGYFQGGRGAKVVYRAFSTGLSGSPMPSFGDALEEPKRWDLVHYILSLAEDGGAAGYLFSDPAGRISAP